MRCLPAAIHLAKKVGARLGSSKILQRAMQKEFELEKSILWIRNDQRVADNRALVTCIERAMHVIPVFVIDERLFHKNGLGLPNASRKRLNFLAQSLRQLISEYKRMGGNVLIKYGNPAKEISKLASALGIKEIFASKEYTTYETEDEFSIQKNGITLHLFENSTLLDIEDLNFKLHQLPETFTIFRKKVEAHWQVNECMSAPTSISIDEKVDYELSHSLISIHLESNDDLSFFEGGEEAAKARLQDFIWKTKAIANYKNTRNQLLGNNFSSKLSAWLALGNISPKRIYQEVKTFESQVEKNESTYWLIFELLWRDFFKLTALKHQAKLFLENGMQGKKKFNVNDASRLKSWTEGKTGNPFIDANLRELISTGYMSNRGRQNVASYFIHDLKLNWQLGAQFFEHHLIDFDPALNYCNWQYIAGIGNDPKPIRYFDTIWQANNYDPNGEYIKAWIPEYASIPAQFRHTPWLFDSKKYIKPLFLKPKV